MPEFGYKQPPVDPQSAPGPSLLELRETAMAEGFAAGKQEGLEVGRQEVQAAAAQFFALAEAMTKPFHDFDQQVVNELSTIVRMVADQVVRQEVALNPGLVNKLVESALAMLSSVEGDAQIMLNPADSARVRAHLAETHSGITWRIVEDNSIAQGGCQVKTPVSYIDMSLQRQIDMAMEQLLQPLQDADPGSSTDAANPAAPAD
jgi:flagellar assembly protein FliH